MCPGKRHDQMMTQAHPEMDSLYGVCTVAETGTAAGPPPRTYSQCPSETALVSARRLRCSRASHGEGRHLYAKTPPGSLKVCPQGSAVGVCTARLWQGPRSPGLTVPWAAQALMTLMGRQQAAFVPSPPPPRGPGTGREAEARLLIGGRAAGQGGPTH